MRLNRIGVFTTVMVTTAMVMMNGCEQICTLKGCTDRYTLDLESSAGVLPAARYTLSLTFDGTLVDDCVVLISDDAECGEGPCIVQNSCTLVDSLDNELSGLRISTVMWEGKRPEAVGINVSRDGQGILERTLSPSYTEFFPNGEECDETGCFEAMDSLVLPN